MPMSFALLSHYNGAIFHHIFENAQCLLPLERHKFLENFPWSICEGKMLMVKLASVLVSYTRQAMKSISFPNGDWQPVNMTPKQAMIDMACELDGSIEVIVLVILQFICLQPFNYYMVEWMYMVMCIEGRWTDFIDCWIPQIATLCQVRRNGYQKSVCHFKQYHTLMPSAQKSWSSKKSSSIHSAHCFKYRTQESYSCDLPGSRCSKLS